MLSDPFLFLVFISVFLLIVLVYKVLYGHESFLFVENLPEGTSFVEVLPGNIPQEALCESYKKHTGYIALANGNSPYNLVWYRKITAGIKYVVIKLYPCVGSYTEKSKNSNALIKIISVYFTEDGDASINWEDMIDFFPFSEHKSRYSYATCNGVPRATCNEVSRAQQ